ncbi:hypothetical protein, conserved [Trypanosoma brucei brucei TREU927]|uniref:Uncharacterized protein n=2 Tax=Trypanosoma brucei TaxID=5691 RepID=Q57X23_TRYB2|nr:hypothetical protein, conserved [Trypanosoma brucei brucei TREU927]AAX69844.1 hypothetical protein, conserved [Trypanosoma brucei]AAZ13323.1 hypothetical protein, conserved [Trypanosoma brucei brucei TREU927]RHW73355.1 SH3-binding [Trypanosoma brucei equiperdum]
METRKVTECTPSPEEEFRSGTSLKYPDEERTRQQLTLAFPSIDADVIEEMAFLVGRKRYTIDKVVYMLRLIEESMKLDNPANKGLVNSGESEGQEVQVLQEGTDDTSTGHSLPLQSSQPQEGLDQTTMKQQRDLPEGNRGGVEELQPFMLSYSNSHSANFVGVKLFFTSMTGDRRIRDHCRRAETLLYLKRITYEPVNVADSPTLQRNLREMYAACTGKRGAPPLPALFVGTSYVGNYEEMQEMEDDGTLMDTLEHLGYKHEIQSSVVTR